MALVVATSHRDLNIHALFSHYNSTYFDCALSSCFVEWSSPDLTSCTATCTYLQGYCQITLSWPLLMYLSSDHVKNTLLHEMIHAYLFVTKKIRSHGTHGPKFQQFMNLINYSTITDDQRPSFGYKIMLFHDFHDEDVVDDNIAQYWMCQKCGDTTKRATTTQPSFSDCAVQAHHARKTCSYSDCHWHRHKVKCDGTYMKRQKLEEHHDKKKAILKGSARFHDSESLEKLIPEKTGKSIMTYSRRTIKLLPSSDKSNSSATSHDLSNPKVKKPPEGNRSVKGKSPQLRTFKEEISQPAHTSPYPSKAVLEGKPQQSTWEKRNSSHPEMEKANEKPKVSEKKVESEVQTNGDITRSLPPGGNSHSHAGSSSGKVVQHRKSEFSSSNMVALSRKRRLTRKELNFQASEHKVVTKWLDYYEDASTDEEIEPLVNIRTVRNIRMNILRESIKREKEENERKLKD